MILKSLLFFIYIIPSDMMPSTGSLNSFVAGQSGMLVCFKRLQAFKSTSWFDSGIENFLENDLPSQTIKHLIQQTLTKYKHWLKTALKDKQEDRLL